jgi:hypothetical protein
MCSYEIEARTSKRIEMVAVQGLEPRAFSLK